MATEKIIIQIGDEVQELKGAFKEAYLAQREADQFNDKQRQAKLEALKQTKVSAYTKLGLTTEEIDAIL